MSIVFNCMCFGSIFNCRLHVGASKMLVMCWPTVHRQVTDSQKWETLFTIPDSQHLDRAVQNWVNLTQGECKF